jgi:hypothetical protein
LIGLNRVCPGVDLPAERQYRHPVALTALRPFVRLSRRLERQVVAPAPGPPTPPDRPDPAPATAAAAPPTAPPAVAAPATATTAPPATQPPAARPESSPESTDQFQDVDASVVPVPIESLNRLVIAVDELGSEMTHVREAIRELTATLSESQAGFARILAGQGGTAGSLAPDPLAAVTGPYVSGSPSPTPFTAPPQADAAGTASRDALDPAWLTPANAAEPSPPNAASPAPAPFSFPDPPTVPMPTAPAASAESNGLGDLPIVHTGEVPVVIGPISSLDQLDDAVDHIRQINGVETVSVTAFEGSQVVLTVELLRALPLASLLRTDLGREVASCRLVDGRIVVDFGDAGRRA